MDAPDHRLECAACPVGGRCDEPLEGWAARLPEGEEGPPICPNVCPRRHVAEHGLPLGDPFGWFALLHRGVLPLAGGFLDQPQPYVETMHFLARLRAETQRRVEARAASEAATLQENAHGTVPRRRR